RVAAPTFHPNAKSSIRRAAAWTGCDQPGHAAALQQGLQYLHHSFTPKLTMPSTPGPNAPLTEWLAYLETLHPTAIDMGLARITEVAKRLNLTLPCVRITVGGTNGKGSTCALLEAIYLAAGYKV